MVDNCCQNGFDSYFYIVERLNTRVTIWKPLPSALS